MSNIVLSPLFEAIYQIETIDPVLGGVNGIANRQAKQLGNRTEFLKEAIEAAGLGEAAGFTGDVSTIVKSGFYIIESASTNKPTTGRGYLLCIGKTNVAAGITSFYTHIYINTSREVYIRSYQNGTPYGAWNKMQSAEDAGAFNDSFVGAVQAFAGNTVPSGWLKCNGAVVSRTSYAALFAKVGTTYGSGNGSTTFNLPDLRGEFVRGFDDGRGVDAGRVFGTAQGHQLEDHVHGANVDGRETVVTQDGVGLTPGTAAGGIFTDGVDGTTANVGAETRPRNVAMLYCIKY